MTGSDRNSVGSGAYVLDAMDENEREEFEAELSESEELRNEVTELADTAVLLGTAVDPVAPSAALRASIMSRLASTPQAAALPVRADESSTWITATARRRWFNRPVVTALAGAAAVLLIVGGTIGVNNLAHSVTQQQQADALAAINAAPDVRHAAATVSTGGTATLVWSLQLHKSALMMSGLSVLPNTKTYELWYINSAGLATKAGLFESTGRRAWEVLTGTMSAGDTIGVTVEPAGGSNAPTTKPIVAIVA